MQNKKKEVKENKPDLNNVKPIVSKKYNSNIDKIEEIKGQYICPACMEQMEEIKEGEE